MSSEKTKVLVIEDDNDSLRLIPIYFQHVWDLDEEIEVHTHEWNEKKEGEQLDNIPDDISLITVDGLNGKWKTAVEKLVAKGYSKNQIIIHTAGERIDFIGEGIEFVAKPTGDSLEKASKAILSRRKKS